jgi:hypothetical protein
MYEVLEIFWDVVLVVIDSSKAYLAKFGNIQNMKV